MRCSLTCTASRSAAGSRGAPGGSGALRVKRNLAVAGTLPEGHASVVRIDEAAIQRRREQNLRAQRADSRGVTPSIRSFGQAIDRQRQGVERGPLPAAVRPGVAALARALDE